MIKVAARGRPARDDGFTIVEALVASFVAILLFAAFATAMTTALRGARINASAQVATAIGVEHIEFARSLSWDQLAMSEIHADAPLIDYTSGVLLASEAGLEQNEPLVESFGGLVAPNIVDTVDQTSYTVWQYITFAGDGVRRVVVYVTWTSGAAGYTHLASTLVAEAATR
jgi:hypothetical protein